jgi:hypothetical protein
MDIAQLPSDNMLLHGSSTKDNPPVDKENARKPPQSARKLATPNKQSVGEINPPLVETFSRVHILEEN